MNAPTLLLLLLIFMLLAVFVVRAAYRGRG